MISPTIKTYLHVEEQYIKMFEKMVENFKHKVQIDTKKQKEVELDMFNCYWNDYDSEDSKNECIILIGYEFEKQVWKIDNDKYYKNSLVSFVQNQKPQFEKAQDSKILRIKRILENKCLQKKQFIFTEFGKSLINSFNNNSRPIPTITKKVSDKECQKIDDNQIYFLEIDYNLKDINTEKCQQIYHLPQKLRRSSNRRSTKRNSINYECLKQMNKLLELNEETLQKNKEKDLLYPEEIQKQQPSKRNTINLKNSIDRYMIKNSFQKQKKPMTKINVQVEQFQDQAKKLIIYLPNKNLTEAQLSYNNSKMTSILQNYITFNKDCDVKMYQYHLGQNLQQFLKKNLVEKFSIHFNFKQNYDEYPQTMDLLKKVSNIQCCQDNRPQAKLMARHLSLKILQKNQKQHISNLKNNIMEVVNYLGELVSIRPMSYEQITYDKLKKIKGQNIKRGTNKIKEMLAVSNSLDLQLKDLEHQKQLAQEKMKTENQQYLQKIAKVRKQIKELEIQIQKKNVKRTTNLSEMSRQSVDKQIGISRQSKQIQSLTTPSKSKHSKESSSSINSIKKSMDMQKKKLEFLNKYKKNEENLRQSENMKMNKIMSAKRNELLFEAQRQFQNKKAQYINANMAIKMMLMNLE